MPGQFIPASSTRHRLACCALYRALVREGVRVPLPDDVLAGLGPAHPIRRLVRNAFRRNKRETSARLVTSALTNGYKFLSLLTAAQAPSDPQHASLLAFLRDNQSRVQAMVAANTATREAYLRNHTGPNSGTIPLLTRVPVPVDFSPTLLPHSTVMHRMPPLPYTYISSLRPRPLAHLGAGASQDPGPDPDPGSDGAPSVPARRPRRRIPVMDDYQGFPFLRFSKPHPRYLTRVLRHKYERRQWRITRMITLNGEDLVAAMREDQWDWLMERLERRGADGVPEYDEGGNGEAVARMVRADMQARAIAVGGNETVEDEKDFDDQILTTTAAERLHLGEEDDIGNEMMMQPPPLATAGGSRHRGTSNRGNRKKGTGQKHAGAGSSGSFRSSLADPSKSRPVGPRDNPCDRPFYSVGRHDPSSFGHAVRLAMAHLSWAIDRDWQDVLERGRVLWNTVLAEEKLAEQEKEDRLRGKALEREGRRQQRERDKHGKRPPANLFPSISP